MSVNCFHWALSSNLLVFIYFTSTTLEVPHEKVDLYQAAEQVRCLCISLR